jgi:3-carboxy-cis,cis-muconate cycloisomerase
MSVSPFDSMLFGALLSDAEIAPLFDDAEQLRRMLRVEAALARVEGRLGMIPAAAAEAIAAAAERLRPEPTRLAAATAKDGVPVPALIAALRETVPAEARGFVHWGATSQDIIDTALVLIIADSLRILESRLSGLADTLGALANRHRRTVMPGRTRFQPAVPITFGAKVAGWLAPLLRDLRRLAEMRPRLLVLSLGGAAGTLSSFGGRGYEVARALADELGLGIATAPWHAARDNFAELASWLALLTGTFGKIGEDIILLAQSEIGELALGAVGGSSTMPQKSNPVGPETLVALARFNAASVGTMMGAMVHAHERDGAAWTLEWLTLPEMVVATGAATRIASAVVGGLVVDETTMRTHVADPPGLLMAEAATFALAAHMPRAEAEALVKQASAEALSAHEHLLDRLARLTPARVDWTGLRNLDKLAGGGEEIVERVLTELRRPGISAPSVDRGKA